MNNQLTAWICLIFLGISLCLFTLYFSHSKLIQFYADSLEIGRSDIVNSSEISDLKTTNSELKSKIESLNTEVNDLGDKMNQHLMEYRTSKMFLDSLMSHTETNAEALDSILTYYNDEILNNTYVIDSINQLYEIKSTTLLKFISDLNSNSSEIEFVLLEREINNKILSVKIGSIFYFLLIFIATLIIGIWLTVMGLRKVREHVN